MLEDEYLSRVDRQLLESENDSTTSAINLSTTKSSNVSFLTDWLKIHEHRREVVKRVCKNTTSLHFSYPPLHRFLYEPNNKLLYCRHAKVGTTTWLTELLHVSNVKIKLKGYTSKELHVKVPRIFGLGSMKSLRKKILSAESFTMVRHPFERLVSAYKDKILINDDPNKAELRSNLKIVYGDRSFRSFVTYIVDQAKHYCRRYSKCDLDIHWLPYVARCGYCQVPYKYLLKAENFEEELEGLTLATNVPFEKMQSHKSSGDTRRMVSDLFKQVPQKIIDDLKMLYAPDFQMFEYDSDQFFK